MSIPNSTIRRAVASGLVAALVGCSALPSGRSAGATTGKTERGRSDEPELYLVRNVVLPPSIGDVTFGPDPTWKEIDRGFATADDPAGVGVTQVAVGSEGTPALATGERTRTGLGVPERRSRMRILGTVGNVVHIGPNPSGTRIPSVHRPVVQITVGSTARAAWQVFSPSKKIKLGVDLLWAGLQLALGSEEPDIGDITSDEMAALDLDPSCDIPPATNLVDAVSLCTAVNGYFVESAVEPSKLEYVPAPDGGPTPLHEFRKAGHHELYIDSTHACVGDTCASVLRPTERPWVESEVLAAQITQDVEQIRVTETTPQLSSASDALDELDRLLDQMDGISRQSKRVRSRSTRDLSAADCDRWFHELSSSFGETMPMFRLPTSAGSDTLELVEDLVRDYATYGQPTGAASLPAFDTVSYVDVGPVLLCEVTRPEHGRPPDIVTRVWPDYYTEAGPDRFWVMPFVNVGAAAPRKGIINIGRRADRQQAALADRKNETYPVGDSLLLYPSTWVTAVFDPASRVALGPDEYWVIPILTPASTWDHTSPFVGVLPEGAQGIPIGLEESWGNANPL